MFRERKMYDRYFKQKRGYVPVSYFYLHSKRPWHPDNEIVAYHLPEVPMFARLYHEGWHHYLRARINKPPQWLSEGFGEYFEGCRLGPSGNLVYGLNRTQLERLHEAFFNVYPDTQKHKDKYDNRPLKELFGLSKEWFMRKSDKNPNYSLSWGACYFLRHHPNPEYQRLLTKALRALRPGASRSENSRLVRRIMFRQIPPERFQADFEAFIKQLRAPGEEAFYSGYRAYKSRQYESALAKFEEARQADPLYYRPWLYKGYAYFRLNKYSEAASFLGTSLELYPENAPAYKQLVKANCRCGRWEDALSVADQAARIMPSLKPEMDKLKQSILKKRGTSESTPRPIPGP